MPQEIEIFKAGTHTSASGEVVTLGESHLDEIARSYDPELFDAPAVVGHPRDNSPAYAWVEGVRRVGNKLMANLKDWDADFQKAVKAKRYKKISASFYTPDSPSNPKPGSYYLRHVGFLGGMAPAVKGLKSVAFGEAEEGVVDFCCGMGGDKEIWRNLREWLIEKYGIETSDRVVPAYLLSIPDDSRLNYLENRVNELENFINKIFSPDMESRLTEVGEKVLQLLNTNNYTEEPEPVPSEESIELSERLEKAEAKLRQVESEKKKEAIANFVEGLKGKIRPNQKDQLVEFMMNLPEQELEFAEGKPQSPKAWLQGFLKGLPDLVNLKEVVRDEEIEEFSEEDKRSRSAYADAAAAYEEAWK
ncbi:hypothetical protein I8748_32005 [Nostoc sp. CENA67]|uniref:Peptidase n=1 Tax=Amazonocrinis nigriterrae CENA67 TaxID=2794033 RepID=A0A8J7LBH5_9NOST|nr:hypothetical protein [Amazonocrinis nigriterrae]MBH8566723.1 hypothetical protein [Amazonocrinis nigriterrae CENA67]